MSKVTIYDVARVADVSLATVSRVLNNPEKEMTDTAFKRVIQAETTAVIKAEYNENKATSNPYINIAYGILGAILAGTVLFLIERYRRKRNENYHNYQK